jgi:hypothetical protein
VLKSKARQLWHLTHRLDRLTHLADRIRPQGSGMSKSWFEVAFQICEVVEAIERIEPGYFEERGEE